MAKGFKHGTGGGGNVGLNFKVVGGTSQPASAAENTIWLNTDTDITGWVFSPSQPETPAAGLAWISIGVASAAAFNAVKKQTMMVYPVAAKQYVDGAWANKGAMIYLDGAWVSFSTEAVYLYIEGDTCESLTGGYTVAAMKAASSESGTGTPAVTYGDSSMVIKPVKSTAIGTYIGGIVRTKSKIDCSQYDTLIFEGTVAGISTGNGKIAFWSTMGANQSENQAKYKMLSNGSDPITVDVSDLTGSYYIGFGFDSQNTQITVTMESLRLE